MGVGKNRIARTGFGVLGLAVVGVACMGAERRFTSDGGAAAVLPMGEGGLLQSIPDPIAPPGGQGSGTEESPFGYDLADASALASVSGGSGVCDDQGNCRCDADAESCAPISLCADGGAACDSTCPGCLIGADCVGSDTVNPGNPCQICDPTRDALGWSNNDSVTCEDGLFCTTEDTCGDGRCEGTPLECENGVACDGISTCNEDLDACSPDSNQCVNGAFCSPATGTCVTTCTGCLIDGVCLGNGAEEAGNPCQVCDPTRSASAYSAAVGKSCGAGPSDCSQQDTCDAQGACRPNHLPVDAPCGDSSSSACDRPNSCDGNGACQSRQATNGADCQDGQFCTVGDRCQGGSCVPTGNLNCGANLRCNEGTDRCDCLGCTSGNTCFADDAIDPTNPCRICDPSRSITGFSPNVGASCGRGPETCSAQDTCNAQGTCASNHLSGACNDGRFCTSTDRCENGSCVGSGDPCGASGGCNEDSNACDCLGCNVDNTCYANGAGEPGNPCGICDPSRNRAGFSGRVGASCGRGSETCSGQDTCNEQRACASNHLQFGTGCGSNSSGPCDQPDSCDGNGRCQNRQAGDGTQCVDNLFCNDLDRCLGGICDPRGNSCGVTRRCDEPSDRCLCPGATLTCASPLGGSPNCSTWGFESNTTEGWQLDLVSAGTSSDAHSGDLTISEDIAAIGDHSLAVRFVGSPTKDTVFIRVPLCANNASHNLAGKRLQALVLIVADDGRMTGQGHLATMYTGDVLDRTAHDFSLDLSTGGNGDAAFPPVVTRAPDVAPPGDWYRVEVSIGGEFPSTTATHIGFRFIFNNAWSGTIYLDEIKIL